MDKREYYKTITYGMNIKKRKMKQIILGQKTWTTEIMLQNTTNGLLYIITSKTDLLSEIKSGNIHTIDGTTRCSINDGNDCKYCPSGMVLLCVCKLGAPENQQEYNGVMLKRRSLRVQKVAP